MNSKEYVNLQEMWLKATGVEVGSWVKVTRKAETHESGWDNAWWPAMDKYVGNVFVVGYAHGGEGICLDAYEHFKFPFFILELVKGPKPEKYTFTPFEQVLTRNYNSDNWTANLFSYIEDGIFACTDAFWTRCIPYAGHEHLLGTTDEPKDWAKYYDKV